MNKGYLAAREKLLEAATRERLLRIEEYNKNPKKCKKCQKTLPYEKRMNTFCGHICANDHVAKTKLGRPRKSKKCKNCDAQTDTYKSKNKSNGRFVRRQRFKEGKPY